MPEQIILPATYDSNLPNQNLIYLGANDLYGWAMSQFLPKHGFHFLSTDETAALKLEDLCNDSEDGYIYEVDLHYPTELHNMMTIPLLQNHLLLTTPCILQLSSQYFPNLQHRGN